MPQRMTKLVATIGPASSKPSTIRKMSKYVDAFRINTSHNSLEEAEEKFRAIRRASPDSFVFLDMQGPKIRSISEDFEAPTGSKLVYGKDFSTDYKLKLKKGDVVLVDDGKIEMRYDGKYLEVVRGGLVKRRKGVVVPGYEYTIQNPTARDRKYLTLAEELGADAIALSFVNNPKEIKKARKLFSGRIISKIETLAALERINEISEESDIVMVARGDLALETGMFGLPEAQEKIIEASRLAGKPVIVATQVAESLVSSTEMTRAEVSDIYLAGIQGADAVMLSNETAVGADPVRAVMKVSSLLSRPQPSPKTIRKEGLAFHLGEAAAVLACDIGAKSISALTRSGLTAYAVSHFRPPSRIVGITNSKETQRFLRIVYGVEPVYVRGFDRMLSVGRKKSEIVTAGSGLSGKMRDFIMLS